MVDERSGFRVVDVGGLRNDHRRLDHLHLGSASPAKEESSDEQAAHQDDESDEDD